MTRASRPCVPRRHGRDARVSSPFSSLPGVHRCPIGGKNQMSEKPWKPTREQLAAAVNKTVPDVIAPELKVLFCGINPGLYTAAIGHHFGRPGNRFWPALHGGGFTPRLFSPFEEQELLPLGYGITNVVAARDGRRGRAAAGGVRRRRETAGSESARVRAAHARGARRRRVPHGVRSAEGGRSGPQDETIGDTSIWVLPNPSGLNAHLPRRRDRRRVPLTAAEPRRPLAPRPG